ncbi:MAG: helix-turn-helix domain-containing protein [Oscillospiraceae bacterium]|jgi:transcriptional regulator with XRE-family HTH domain|nr:helix-turn-helix domain-containing protein [Oscillospiraceae bacterium]
MHPGERMRLRRKELDISGEKLAELIGISSKTYYQYENGSIANMSATRLIKICKVLHTTPEYILDLEDYTPSTISLAPSEVEGADKQSLSNLDKWIQNYKPKDTLYCDLIETICAHCPAHDITCPGAYKGCRKNFIKWVNSLVSSSKKD